jgi:cytochrome c553
MKYKIILFFLLGTLLTATVGQTADIKVTAPELIDSLGCKGCHFIANSGATLAPSLSNSETSLSEKTIITRLKQGAEKDNQFMPAYHWLTDEQNQAIAQYLKQLKK